MAEYKAPESALAAGSKEVELSVYLGEDKGVWSRWR